MDALEIVTPRALAVETATVATAVSVVALVLSGLSYWATQLRRGRLLCNSPAEIAWIRMPEPGIQLALPLV